MLDTQGPEIRTGKNKDGKPISLKQGQILEISTDNDIEGDETIIGCNYESLPSSVDIGGTVFIQDATVNAEIVEILDVSN